MVVSSLVSWYLAVNPSTPVVMAYLVAIVGVFVFAYLILSSVDSFVDAKMG